MISDSIIYGHAQMRNVGLRLCFFDVLVHAEEKDLICVLVVKNRPAERLCNGGNLKVTKELAVLKSTRPNTAEC